MPDDTHVTADRDRLADPSSPDDDGPAPLRAKIVTGLVGIAVLFGSGWLLLRVSSPAIAPSSKPPAGHYPLSCPVCHSVSTAVPIKGAK
jgi:hypothetical protein